MVELTLGASLASATFVKETRRTLCHVSVISPPVTRFVLLDSTYIENLMWRVRSWFLTKNKKRDLTFHLYRNSTYRVST